MSVNFAERPSNTSNTIVALLMLIVAVCVALHLVDKACGDVRLPDPLVLMTASTAFVLIPVVVGAFKSSYGRLAFAALIFFWLGDFFGPISFVLSVLGFLLGHVALTVAFAAQGISRRRCLVSSAVAILALAGVLAYFLPHVAPNERILVSAYACVISAMVALAGGMVDTPHRRLIVVAAVVFYVSDVFVAHWLFLSTTGLEPFFCYPLYYSACVMFGLTASQRNNAPARVCSCA